MKLAYLYKNVGFLPFTFTFYTFTLPFTFIISLLSGTLDKKSENLSLDNFEKRWSKYFANGLNYSAASFFYCIVNGSTKNESERKSIFKRNQNIIIFFQKMTSVFSKSKRFFCSKFSFWMRQDYYAAIIMQMAANYYAAIGKADLSRLPGGGLKGLSHLKIKFRKKKISLYFRKMHISMHICKYVS